LTIVEYYISCCIFLVQYHTPQLKRKRGDDQSANSNSSALTEEIQKMHEMLKSINQKLDHMEQKEVIFEKQLGILNKRFGRLTDNMREKVILLTRDLNGFDSGFDIFSL